MSNSFYHKDLTEAQWNRIKFMFEKPAKVGRPALNPRSVFNALMWILKSGARWRDLPARYGNWNSIYHKFRLWCSLGLFERLLKSLMPIAKTLPCLRLIRLSVRCIRVPVRLWKSKQSGRRAAAKTPKSTSLSTRKCNFWMWYWPAGTFTTRTGYRTS